MSLRLGALDDTKSQDEIAKLVRGAAQGQDFVSPGRNGTTRSLEMPNGPT